jgi:hypothetical protein
MDAAVVNNNVRGVNDTYGLIHLLFTDGTLVAANEISGTSAPNYDYGTTSDPFGGIVIQGGTNCSILGNRVADLAVIPDPAGAAILLDSGTSGCMVVGPCRPGDVKNLGTNNKVLCSPH